MARLSALERRFVSRYQGLPAIEICKVEPSLTVDGVLAVWRKLKEQGVVRAAYMPHPGPVQEQLSLDQIDRMMRGNRAPAEPTNHEIGWTTSEPDALW